MNGRPEDLAPRARQSGLVVRELDGETLIYDRKADKAICLNAMAAGVWKRCDGHTSVAEMIPLLQQELGTYVDEYTVYSALARLSKDNLLDERVLEPSKRGTISRRDMMVKAGIGAAMLPVITAISLPTAHASSSCVTHIPPGSTCINKNNTGCCADADCCNCQAANHCGCCVTSTGTCGVCTSGTCEVNSTPGPPCPYGNGTVCANGSSCP